MKMYNDEPRELREGRASLVRRLECAGLTLEDTAISVNDLRLLYGPWQPVAWGKEIVPAQVLREGSMTSSCQYVYFDMPDGSLYMYCDDSEP
jgi:hypothetical protein